MSILDIATYTGHHDEPTYHPRQDQGFHVEPPDLYRNVPRPDRPTNRLTAPICGLVAAAVFLALMIAVNLLARPAEPPNTGSGAKPFMILPLAPDKPSAPPSPSAPAESPALSAPAHIDPSPQSAEHPATNPALTIPQPHRDQPIHQAQPSRATPQVPAEKDPANSQITNNNVNTNKNTNSSMDPASTNQSDKVTDQGKQQMRDEARREMAGAVCEQYGIPRKRCESR